MRMNVHVAVGDVVDDLPDGQPPARYGVSS
jgi:hypothetical protein